MPLILCFFLGVWAAPLPAALRPIGAAEIQVFDPGSRAFRGRGVLVVYQPPSEGAEVLQVHLPGFEPQGPFNARLQVDRLPHYQAWLDQRRQEGGAAWKALEALLGELQGRPAVFLTHGPLPAQGRAEVQVGLMRGSRFELYGRAWGRVASGRRGTVFELEDWRPEKASARAAWALLAPLARRQAARAAGQR